MKRYKGNMEVKGKNIFLIQTVKQVRSSCPLGVFWFAQAAITKYHPGGDLREIYFLTVSRKLEV